MTFGEMGGARVPQTLEGHGEETRLYPQGRGEPCRSLSRREAMKA